MFRSLTRFTTSLHYGLAVVLVWLLPVLASAAAGDGLSFKVKSLIGPDSIEGLLLALLQVFITIATPIIVLAIIYAGFLYVTARGNTQQTEQATRALTYAVIGAVLVLGAVAIAAIIAGVVDSFKS